MGGCCGYKLLVPGDSSRGLLIPNLEVTNNLWVRVTNHHPKNGLVESPGSFTLESRTLRLSCRVYFRGFRMSLLEKFTTITASSGCHLLQLPGFCCLCSSGVPFWWTIFHINKADVKTLVTFASTSLLIRILTMAHYNPLCNWVLYSLMYSKNESFWSLLNWILMYNSLSVWLLIYMTPIPRQHHRANSSFFSKIWYTVDLYTPHPTGCRLVAHEGLGWDFPNLQT